MIPSLRLRCLGMARSKTSQELYRLMSEVISLRERVAQAELAAMSRDRVHRRRKTEATGTSQQNGAGGIQPLPPFNNPSENHPRRDPRLKRSR